MAWATVVVTALWARLFAMDNCVFSRFVIEKILCLYNEACVVVVLEAHAVSIAKALQLKSLGVTA
jgi:hypothetical protein